MMRVTVSTEMEQQNSHEPAMGAGQFSARPSSCFGSLKPPIASRSAHRTRSAAPSAQRPVPSAPAPRQLPGDPPGIGSNLRGLSRRPGPARRCCSPGRKRIVPVVGEKEDRRKRMNGPSSGDLLDGVPVEVARMVVNMQEYYASAVDELTGKLVSVREELRRAKDENEEMKKRLDMHLVMLREAAEFMQRASEECLRGGVERVVSTMPEVGDVSGGEDGLPMRGVEMETPVVDKEPVKNTSRKASRRRPVGGKHSTRVREKKQARLREESTSHSEDQDGIRTHLREAPQLEMLPEEESRQRSENDDGGADEDGLKILDGAPWLRALLRRSAWTAINIPARRHSSSVDTNLNTDYRRCSPSASSSSSSSPSASHPIYRNTTKPSPPQPPQPRPRYSTPRHTTTPRHASGPARRPFRFHRMGRTVLDVWREYKHGAKGNPAIESLEAEFGTGWRTGTLREIKYASNYVGVRQKVVGKVEEMCEREGIGAEEACRRLDERVDGRMQMLISAVRKGEDPFEVIPKRRGVDEEFGNHV